MEIFPAINRSKYSLKVVQSASMPLRWRCSATYSSNTGPTSGATVWLSPMMSRVTPWRILLSPLPSLISGWSLCVCMSMKPGVTTLPRTSMERVPEPGSSLPMAAILPSLIARSP